ncbi:Vacuolar ATPase assembly integral membrane protein VMA21-like [Melia azedarach]|uniref:Vacuolar ATPase assembly integral membrane protein VMA21-like n=1 Tax=Melia azedarach TaxID=155640 RepID=A0ACC1WUE1_MELAZ|nr:Vacuolar ATPase assembly integral membrane protein VMA21-like [Melia azedarach]
MAAVVKKFFIASMFMWIAPLAILYGFNHNLLPGSTNLSPYSMTLLSGFLAVISVNIVIAFYIYLAMKEPSDKHEPDPVFLAAAKASVSQTTQKPEVSSESLKKED